MKRILLLSFAFLTVIAFSAMAQRTVSGKVTDDGGEALPGVNVVIKGTTTGTTTDLDGNYRLSVDEGATLVFSFVGFETQEVEVGARTTIDISMGGATELQEVIVTAQGLEREKRALGYAVTSVEGEDISRQPEADIGRSLQSKVPGVNINQTNGMSGSGTNIIIRGYTTVTGSNQPLFVVDGVPFNTNTEGSETGTNFVDGGQTSSSRFLDLDPNNIESVNVLKGLSATTIYGEQGSNGVILITTKNGARPSGGKLNIDFSQSYHVSKIASLPEYQTSYGNGFHQNFGFFFSNWGPNFNTRGERGIDANGTVAHPLSLLADPDLLAQFTEFADARYEYRPYGGPEGFFSDGSISVTSIGISGGNEKGSLNARVSYTNDVGFVPNNELEKINISFGGRSQVADRLTLSTSVNVARTNYQSPPVSFGNGSGTGGQPGLSVFADLFYTPTSVDLNGLPFESPTDRRSVYYRSGNDIQNPRWTAKYARNLSVVTRLTTNTTATFQILDWLDFSYGLSLDTYTDQQEFRLNKGSVQNNALISGLYTTKNIVNTVWQHDWRISGSRELSSDLTLDGAIGFQTRYDNFERDGTSSTGQLVFGFFEHSNFTSQASVDQLSLFDIMTRREEKWNGLWGDFTLAYRDFLYFNANARNDWTSTLEPENNSILYAGGSVSFIPTAAFDLDNAVLDFAKIRLGYGTSAGFADPYSTRSVATTTSRAFVDATGAVTSTNGYSNFLGNPDLKPELQRELELGLEAQLLSNRIGLDISVYSRTTDDLITQAPVDPSSGYTSTFVNVGQISNKGIEAGINGTPLRLANGFEWNIFINYFAYESTVEELGTGIDEVVISGFTNLGNFAIEGEPFNVMKGSVIARDADGNAQIDGDGYFLPADEIEIIGDPNPDFTSSITNTFSWKGLSLSVQIDYRKGGDLYSGTTRALLARGITTDTDFDRTQSFVLDGVTADGQPNTTMLTATNLYFDNYGFGPSELSVFDGSLIRLREVSLSYNIPKSLIANTFIQGATVTLSGSNLWYDAINLPDGMNVDPDLLGLGVGNGLGFEFLTGPSVKRFGGSVRLKF